MERNSKSLCRMAKEGVVVDITWMILSTLFLYL